MPASRDLLLTLLDEAFAHLTDRTRGLTDDEYLWEPAPGCWTVHPGPDLPWVDYAFPDPEPAPLTTIGWRLVHIADCKLMYHEWAFGERRLTFPDLVPPLTAARALDRLGQGHALLRAALLARAAEQLDEPATTNWGEQWPTWRIFTTMVDHDTWHGGEIGCLRDLYRCSGGAISGPRAG